ncbi:hypothetical protein WL1483_3116 [Aeromonas schubertii]|uniref:Uncharacterized protein n=1 Tax=Aeromonas schubertii TaxID=652 RepID=A0A0S2SLH6_9GAMM|nr:hypothetical protein WL1483_3116 [Aeromonas schubertii]
MADLFFPGWPRGEGLACLAFFSRRLGCSALLRRGMEDPAYPVIQADPVDEAHQMAALGRGAGKAQHQLARRAGLTETQHGLTRVKAGREQQGLPPRP